MHAEDTYLFRHALLRDAAYELQLPAGRSLLHGLVVEIVQTMLGGLPPLPEYEIGGESRSSPHPQDSLAAELAEHALQAQLAAPSRELKRAERVYLHRAAVFAGRAYDHQSAQQLWLRLSGCLDGEEAADALRCAGAVAYRAGRWGEAEQLYDRALDVARASGSRRLQGILLGSLAVIYDDTGRNELAEVAFKDALTIHTETGEERFRAYALGNFAILHHNTSRLEEAESLFGECLDILRRIGDRRAEAAMLSNLGNLYFDLERPQEGEAAYLKALHIQREIGDRRSEGIALANLAHGYPETHGANVAAKMMEEALDIHREVGDRRFMGITLGNLGVVQCNYLRDLPLAERSYREALEIVRSVGDRQHEASILCNLSLLRLRLGFEAEARTIWSEGVHLLVATGDTLTLQRKTATMQQVCEQQGIGRFEVPTPSVNE